MTLLIISISLALGVSFICSLMEATLLSLTPGQIADLSAVHPRAGAVWKRYKQDVSRPIAVILTLNTTANTVGATVSGAKFAVLFGDAWLGAFTALFTYLVLQFAEILPKTLGVRFNRRLAVPFAVLLGLLEKVLHPILFVLALVNRPFERRQTDLASTGNVDELVALARLARVDRNLSAHQERIITGAATLANRRVRDVLVPVGDITYLSTSMSLVDAIITAHLDPHTRFPVIEQSNTNKVLGYVNFKELIYRVRTNPVDPTLSGIIRPVHEMSPEVTCADALQLFVEEHTHLAIVRDAGGAWIGLITLEDLLEELLGKLGDEFERLPKMVQSLGQGVWIMGGGVPFVKLAAALNLAGVERSTLPLAAWMTEGGQPAVLGRVRRHAGYDFSVRRVRRGKVFEVLVAPEGKGPPDMLSAARADCIVRL